MLMRRGRDVDSINIFFEKMPVYRRLQRMLYAYAIFALQSECTSLAIYVTTACSPAWALHYPQAACAARCRGKPLARAWRSQAQQLLNRTRFPPRVRTKRRLAVERSVGRH